MNNWQAHENQAMGSETGCTTEYWLLGIHTGSMFSGECTHDPATSKTVTGVCNAVTLDNFKPICVDGSGQACPAGTCNCKEGDAHIYQIPI